MPEDCGHGNDADRGVGRGRGQKGEIRKEEREEGNREGGATLERNDGADGAEYKIKEAPRMTSDERAGRAAPGLHGCRGPPLKRASLYNVPS